MSDLDLAAFEQAAGVTVERNQPSDLADVLERVLDTGIVIAGEIRIDLLDIELLTIRLRLVVTSIDKAEEVGLDWWRGDAWYSAGVEREPGRGRRLTANRDGRDDRDDRDNRGDDEQRFAIPVVDVARDERFDVQTGARPEPASAVTGEEEAE